MKKIFTLVAGLFITAAMFAADRKPVVSINNNNNFKVVVDGKSYFGDDMTIRISDFFDNRHTVKVYEMKRGFFDKREKLVDAATFRLDRNDVFINIDRFGNIQIREISNMGRFGKNDKNGRDNKKSYGTDKKDDHNKQKIPTKRF